MADIGEDVELGEVLLILGAVAIGGYLLYKLISALPGAIGLSVTNLEPTFTSKDGATLGVRCVVPAIINSGQVTDSMRAAIKAEEVKSFPGIPRAQVEANVDWAVNATNAEAAKGPNALQYAVNYWTGLNWGVQSCKPKVIACSGCGAVPGQCCVTYVAANGQGPCGVMISACCPIFARPCGS